MNLLLVYLADEMLSLPSLSPEILIRIKIEKLYTRYFPSIKGIFEKAV